MFLKTTGSIRYVVKDHYPVYLPPIPQRQEIIGHELKKSDQFWRRVPLPKFYEERRAEEFHRQQKELELVDEGVLTMVRYFDNVLEAYRREQWQRRIYGVHFMNNGVPTYITGTHYYFLQWCKLDHPENDGYPIFYMPQLERFYFRQLCMEDPFCLGYLIVGPRGGGKTAEEVAAQLENITRPGHTRHAAIQSKSFEDATTVIFQEKMVPIFNSLPDFFRPQFSHGSDPKDSFTFKRSSKRGKDARFVKHGEEFELGNTVICYPPQNKALDGKTISDLINDEIGKLTPIKDTDAYTRNSVNTRTVFRNQQKRGIIRATTTVEEMEQGGEECLEIWEESNPLIRDGNGYTISKLYKYFVSAVETQTDLADKYGVIPHQVAYDKIMNERLPVIDDNFKLSLLMRKNPTTEEEAFLKDQSKCIYDQMILSKRVSELKIQKPHFRRFTIEWVNGVVDGDVELVDYKDGPLTMYYMPDEFWNKSRKLLNNCKAVINDRGAKMWIPCNNDLFRSATDPVKFIQTDDSRASKMAGHGMLRFIPDLDLGKPDVKDWISHNIMWEYHARHTDPEEDYENIIKLMRYFGHSIMPEANAGEFIKHLHSRGYQKFIIVRKNFDFTVLMTKQSKNTLGKDQAVHSHKEVIESYVKRTAAFIRRHGHRINSIPLLEQLLKFDPKKPTTYDLAVCFGYAILSLEADLDDYFNIQKDADMVSAVIKRYDISGNRSRLLEQRSVPSEEEIGDFEDPNYVKQLMNNG
ncbi:MAG: hypothetical protein WKF87_06865 [Chryseolinea sp.]